MDTMYVYITVTLEGPWKLGYLTGYCVCWHHRGPGGPRKLSYLTGYCVCLHHRALEGPASHPTWQETVYVYITEPWRAPQVILPDRILCMSTSQSPGGPRKSSYLTGYCVCRHHRGPWEPRKLASLTGYSVCIRHWCPGGPRKLSYLTGPPMLWMSTPLGPRRDTVSVVDSKDRGIPAGDLPEKRHIWL